MNHSTPPPDKRDQILAGAMQVFLTRGYADTSMDRVAATAGVSKQTIYSYFQDKERLFAALIERVTLERMQLDCGRDLWVGAPASVLRRLANLYLAKRHDPDYLALLRTVIAESVRFPELAQLYTRTVIQKVHLALSHYLRDHPDLHLADPEAIAQIFLGSLVAFLLAQDVLQGKTVMPLPSERLVDSLVALVLNAACESGGNLAVPPPTE